MQAITNQTLQQHDAALAIAVYNRLITSDPANFGALNSRAMCKVQLALASNDLNLALDAQQDIEASLATAIRCHTAYPEAVRNRALVERLVKELQAKQERNVEAA